MIWPPLSTKATSHLSGRTCIFPRTFACSGSTASRRWRNVVDSFHLRVAQVALAVLGRYGFVLAGGYAVQAHGIVDRPSEDIDLFTNEPDPAKFARAVDEARAAWLADGLTVDIVQSADTFARFTVSDGTRTMRVDMSHDWRADPPVVLDIGPVLSRDDSVGNKVAAVFSRGEARDYIDLHGARTSGYTRAELERLGADHDLGFDLPAVARALHAAQRHSDHDFAAYGLDSTQIADLRAEIADWAADINRR